MTHGARPTVVVLRALGLGDLLTGVPALRAVARAFPKHRICVALPAPLHELVPLVGGIDEAIDARPLAPLAGVAPEPDVAINLHGRGPQSTRVLQRLRPKRLIAFRDPRIRASGPEWRPNEHEVARWCRLLDANGIPADPSNLALPRPDAFVAPRHAGATIVHPGASTPARRWPIERFALVARALRARGERVVITGSAAERELAEELAIRAGIDERDTLAGQTSLLALAALVAGAARVVCGDTGIAHLATAYGTPSVIVFGPVSPLEWGPPRGSAQHRVLWRPRVGTPSDSERMGLLAITPDDVLGEIARLPVPFASPLPSS